MDYKKQKLRSRLNIKFSPIVRHDYSVKRLQQSSSRSKLIQDTSILSKNRSISQIKLPSIEKKKTITTNILQRNQTQVDFVDLKTKIQSMRVANVKVQSKIPINDTLTFLIKNQILTIPKIIALLQNSHSQEFMYMKIHGIYQYQVCNEQNKGNNYITVSSSGMICDGVLIPLEQLIQQFQLYKKLRKIDFFRHYTLIKYMNKWSKGSKKAHFIENKNKIWKLLSLDNPKLFLWKQDLLTLLTLQQQPISFSNNWIDRIVNNVVINKSKVTQRLAEICFLMLQKFQLPISQSTEIMNKVLMNLMSLNMSFQKKIRIEKQLQIFYRIARQLQFYFLFTIGQYIITYLNGITQRIYESNQMYCSTILNHLQLLNPTQDSYTRNKSQILLNASVSNEVQFTIIMNADQQIIDIQPTCQQIQQDILDAIKTFIHHLHQISFKLIRTDNFLFVLKNIQRSNQNYETNNQQAMTLKQYIYSIPNYYPSINQLKSQFIFLQQTFKRRLSLLNPFMQVFKEFKIKMNQQYNCQCVFQDISGELQSINQSCRFIQKIHDEQYFLFGTLSQVEFRQKLFTILYSYRSKVLQAIPLMIIQTRQDLTKKLKDSLNVMSLPIKDPISFIQVANSTDSIEQDITQYSMQIIELERIQQLYQRTSKNQLSKLTQEKLFINQIRSKIRNFKQIKDNSFLKYRKQLETTKQNLINKVQKLNIKQDEFYTLNIQCEVQKINERIINIVIDLKQVSLELIKLNELENFYAIKQTHIPRLEMLTVQYQSLEQIWLIYTQWKSKLQIYKQQSVLMIRAKEQIIRFQSHMRKLQKFVKNIEYQQICQYLIGKLNSHLNAMQLIQQLQGQHLRQADIEQINKMYEKQLKLKIKVEEISLNDITKNNLYNFKQQIQQISYKSKKEKQIELMLVEYLSWWKKVKLQGQPMQQYPLIIIFGENQPMRKDIIDYTTLLINILNHKYGSFVRKQCQKYLRQMSNLTSLLQLTIIHQQKFLNLYPILTSKFAEKQLMQQYKKFNTILSKTMRNVKWLLKPTQNLNQQTHNMLFTHIKQFDNISKVLQHFLQRKRIKFQRFYFLQDDELLQVLVGIAGENNIFRMFQGIKQWHSDEQGIKCGVVGVGGQSLLLKGWTYKNQEPEIVFKQLQDSIKTNLNATVRNIMFNYEIQMKQLRPLYNCVPWMCIYTVEMILFTKQIELNCFLNGISLRAQAALIQDNIIVYSTDARNNQNIITLQLFLLHFTEEMYRDGITSVFDFKWNSFLRYYHQKDSVVMRALGSEHIWGSQYQGLWQMMVNTSDIRRAHACVLGNLKYGNGVLLQGPSGTGKTETLKQLARCMAKYCVLFNCSKQVNISTLHKLLSGLCYTGSWLCLDQINRLTTNIMSVIANQITIIKQAVIQNRETFNFMGKEMKLKPGVGIFSTMNPIYLRRVQLTQNLKVYFRTISVNVPNYNKILQVLLHGLGFTKASILCDSIGKLFHNLSIQLNQNQQYDFGLRTIKFFIYCLQNIKNNRNKNDISYQSNHDSVSHSQFSEEQTVLIALYQTFYSRLQHSDIKTFQKCINDTFKQSNYQPESNFKIKSMKDAPQTGLIVLGNTSCKTTLINEYCKTWLSEEVEVNIFNPNSVDIKFFMGELILGRWKQGIVQKIVRNSLQFPNQTHILILDGKLKSQIIENFNTLLDDSKLLVMPNGTRLRVRNNFKIVMETPNLEMTSPATITRCNVIYVSQADLNKTRQITLMLPILPPDIKLKLQSMLQKFSFQQLQSIYKIFTLLINSEYKLIGLNELIKDDEECQLDDNQLLGIQRCIIYAIHLLGLQNLIKNYLNKQNSLNSRKSIFHHMISFHRYTEGQFIQLQILKIPPIVTLKGLHIPTLADSYCNFIHEQALKKNHSILWRGNRCEGKTTAIKHGLLKMLGADNEKQQIIFIPIDTNLMTVDLLNCLEERMLIKNDVLGHHNLIIYVENVHMSNQQPQEFLRYMIEYKQVFLPKNDGVVKIPPHIFIVDADLQKLNLKSYRFTRHFTELPYPKTDENTLCSLYSTLTKAIIEQTRTPSSFKSTFSMQLEKISQFIVNYSSRTIKLSQQSHKDGLESCKRVGSHELIPLLYNLQALDDKNTRQISDFMLFFLRELRASQVTLQQQYNQLDLLKVSFNEIFKQRHHQEYQKTLRNYNDHPLKSIHFTKLFTGTVTSINQWGQFKTKAQEIFNNQFYLSDFMLNQIIHITRILGWTNKNYFINGTPGIGRKTLFEMACLLSQIQYVQIQDTKDDKKLASDFFNLLKKTFQKNKSLAIIIDTSNEQKNNLIKLIQRNSAGYPAKLLFSQEDTDYAYSSIEDSPDIQYNRFMKSYDEVVADFFTIAIKKIRFLFTSQTNNYKRFLSNNHYLCKQTVVRTLYDMPSESIMQISQKILQLKIPQNDNLKRIASTFLKVYNHLTEISKNNSKNGENYFYYSPILHFRFLEHYGQIYKLMIGLYRTRQDILNRSIAKFQEIGKNLEKIKEKQIYLEPIIKSKQQKTTQLIPILQQKMNYLRKQKLQIKEIQDQIQRQQKQIDIKVENIRIGMNKIQFLVKEANDALMNVKRNQLAEIRNSSQIHPLVKFTIQSLMSLLGESQQWDNIKKVLSDTDLINKIKNCVPNLIDVVKIQEKISQTPEWSYESVSKQSYGLRHICRWISNTIKQQILKKQFQEEKKEITNIKMYSEEKLNKLKFRKQQLIEKQTQMSSLQKQFNQTKQELVRLDKQTKNNEQRQNNAEKIKTCLQSSVLLWSDKLSLSRQMKRHIQANSLFVSMFLYISPFLKQVDKQKLEQKTLQSLKYFIFSYNDNFNSFDFVKNMIMKEKIHQLILKKDENQQFQMNSPLKILSFDEKNDEKLVQLLYHFDKRPILLDPENQATKWLEHQVQKQQNTLIVQSIAIVSNTFGGSYKTIENAIISGHLVILLIDDKLDLFTQDLLKSKIKQSAQRKTIEYNKKLLNLHPNFRLMLCNKNKQQNLQPKLFINHQIINFEVTTINLQKKLLNIILKLENQQAYDSKMMIQIDYKRYEENKQQYEQQLINQFINNPKNIIDDDNFSTFLTNNKQKIQICEQNLEKLSQCLVSMKKLIAIYLPLCKEICIIYQSLDIIGKMNNILSWSVDLFMKYFLSAVQKSIMTQLWIEEDNYEEDSNLQPENFVQNFNMQHFTPNLSRPTSALSQVSSAVLPRIKAEVDRQQNYISRKSQKDLIKDQQQSSSNQKLSGQQLVKQEIFTPFQNLISYKQVSYDDDKRGTMDKQRQRAIITYLLQLLRNAFNEKQRTIWAISLSLIQYPFKQIKTLFQPRKKRNKFEEQLQIGQLPSNLKNYFSKVQSALHQHALSIINDSDPFKKYGNLLSEIQILLICRLVEPKLFYNLAKKLIQFKGYSDLLNYYKTQVDDWFHNSDNIHPILLLMGEDPFQRLTDFITRKKFHKVILLAMGQGKNKEIQNVLESQCMKQNLIILHNLHISEDFFVTLSRTIQRYIIKKPHTNFRIILISKCLSSLPKNITFNCDKYIVQQPIGIPNRMKYINTVLTINTHDSTYRKIAYSLSLLHSIVNDLSQYKSFGWNVNYQFTTSDLSSSLKMLKQILQSTSDTKRYLCNIDVEDLQFSKYSKKIDLVGIKYMIGEVTYVGKLADDIDRQKMRILLNYHLNKQVLDKNYCLHGLSQYMIPEEDVTINEAINKIPEQDSRVLGLHSEIKPNSQQISYILNGLNECYGVAKRDIGDNKLNTHQQKTLKYIDPINHKFQFINRQIQLHNSRLQAKSAQDKNSTLSTKIAYSVDLLQLIKKQQKIFNLRGFINPHQFFIEILKDTAVRNNSRYESVELIWSLQAKESVQNCYGLCNIKLQGGCLRSFQLQDGVQENNITLYVWGAIKKKQGFQKRQIKIPLYLYSERQGQINSYGDNVNLLIYVMLDSSIMQQQFWVLRSTAFIVQI